MTGMDPRLADRRRRVLEERARGGVRRVIWLAVVVVVVGAVAWTLQSPWLSVTHITVTGQSRSNVEGALAEAGIELGRPLLLSPVAEAEDLLLADPWVADAAVARLFPDTIEVRLIEHRPVALVETTGRSIVVGLGGVALVERASPALPVIRLTADVPELGEEFSDDRIVGATEFFAALEPPYDENAVLFESNAELWVETGEYSARLGRPIEMAEKAAALQAVLADGQPLGAVVNVIAPTRPTVSVGGNSPEPSSEG